MKVVTQTDHACPETGSHYPEDISTGRGGPPGQLKCLQDNGFRFPGRHDLSACRPCVERIPAPRSKRAHTRNHCKYHTRTRGAISASIIWKNLAEGRCADFEFPKAMQGFPDAKN